MEHVQTEEVQFAREQLWVPCAHFGEVELSC